MQTESVHRRTREMGDIDRWHQEVLSRRALSRTQFFMLSIASRNHGDFGGLCLWRAMLSPLPAAAEVPDAIAAPGEIPVTSVHAVGAQVYEGQ